MRKVILIVFFVALGTLSMAQIPQKFVYQAVVRDTLGRHLSNRSVRVKVNILKGSTSGTAIYRESYIKRLDKNGLLTIEVGTATPDFGVFDTIDWLSDDYFLKCEYDPTGGTNYNLLITQQILSVPYALISDTALSVAVIDTMTMRYDNELARLDSLIGVYRQHLSNLNDSIQNLPQNVSVASLTEIADLLRRNAEILQKVELIRNQYFTNERNKSALKNTSDQILPQKKCLKH